MLMVYDRCDGLDVNAPPTFSSIPLGPNLPPVGCPNPVGVKILDLTKEDSLFHVSVNLHARIRTFHNPLRRVRQEASTPPGGNESGCARRDGGRCRHVAHLKLKQHVLVTSDEIRCIRKGDAIRGIRVVQCKRKHGLLEPEASQQIGVQTAKLGDLTDSAADEAGWLEKHAIERRGDAIREWLQHDFVVSASRLAGRGLLL